VIKLDLSLDEELALFLRTYVDLINKLGPQEIAIRLLEALNGALATFQEGELVR
jgi:hypothetical protein